jgi:PmbA protein
MSDLADLLRTAEGVVGSARSGEQIEVACSEGSSTSVRVYGGEVESFTSAQTQGIGVRVIVDGREGFASAGSLDPGIVADALAEARDNAGFAEPDELAGVAEPDGVEAVDIDLWDDAVLATSTEDKIGMAIDLERTVTSADPRITGVRTATYGDSAASFVLASTSGIRASSRATSASVGVQALADDSDGRTQTGSGFDAARSPASLDVLDVADRAVRQAVDLLGATKPPSGSVELVLDPRIAATVFGLISGTLTGDRILKKRSPFVGRIGESIASPLVTLYDDPTDAASLGADSHDGEGLACRRNGLIADGDLEAFLYDSYNGRKAGVGSTGSAVRGVRGLPSPGVQALHLAEGGGGSVDDLIASVDHGVLVFSLAGLHSGVNPVSGDFSVGLEGRMIRDGVLAEPIAECTVGSTLQRLLLGVSTVGSNVEHLPSGVSTPGVVVSDVMLSGSS